MENRIVIDQMIFSISTNRGILFNYHPPNNVFAGNCGRRRNYLIITCEIPMKSTIDFHIDDADDD